MEHNLLPNPSDNCLPDGYIARSDGIYQVTVDRDGESQEAWLCSPITVVARVHNSTGTGWGRLVEFSDPAGQKHQWAILDSSTTNKVLAGLSHRGLQISGEPSAKKAIMALLREWAPDRDHMTMTDRLGWLDDTFQSFTLGDGRIVGDQNVRLDSPDMVSAASAMVSLGSLSEWRASVASQCIGNPLLVLGVSLAFSGPLLELLGVQGGGFHLSGRSSSGKSTIQIVAGSVWGSRDFACSWRATANGLEGVAAARNSTLLVLDEMGEATGKEVGEAAYMLAHGVGKQRAGSSGNARPLAKWCLVVLSSGEVTLAHKMAEDGQKSMAGQEVRLIDIVADNRRYGAFDDLHGQANGADFADKLNRATLSNYGAAGPEFVRLLIKNSVVLMPVLKRQVEINKRDFLAAFNSIGSDLIARALSRFAFIATAGQVATKLGLTGWINESVFEAVKIAFGEWLDAQDNVNQSEREDAIERTRIYLVKHGIDRFERAGVAPLSKQAGFADSIYFYINDGAWREIHHGNDSNQAAIHLHSAGLLTRGEGKNMRRKTPMTLRGRLRGYAVRREIISSQSDSSVLLDSGSDKSANIGDLGLAA